MADPFFMVVRASWWLMVVLVLAGCARVPRFPLPVTRTELDPVQHLSLAFQASGEGTLSFEVVVPSRGFQSALVTVECLLQGRRFAGGRSYAGASAAAADTSVVRVEIPLAVKQFTWDPGAQYATVEVVGELESTNGALFVRRHFATTQELLFDGLPKFHQPDNASF